MTPGQLMNTGLRLGSPAPASNGADSGGWLDQFMQQAKSNGYRVDFICLHWYGGQGGNFDTGTQVDALRSYVTAVHNRYQLPIWMTEFGLINYGGGGQPSDSQQAAFASASSQMLNSLAYVERFAWFSLPSYNYGNTYLANGDGSLTPTGASYSSVP